MGDDKEYSNREIDKEFDRIHYRLQEILDQTKRTNGRVSALENWKWFITGGLAVVTGLLLPIIAFVVKNWRF